MATIDYVLFDNAGSQVVTWSNGEDGDFGQAIDLSAFPDKTVSSDGIATMQGSMDGTTWITLTDFSGADIVFAANTAFVIRENFRYIRPAFGGFTTVRLTAVR